MKPRALLTYGTDRWFEAAGTIERVHYAPSTRRLLVTFKGGNSYVYLEVPPEVFEVLRGATNLAGAFAEYVRRAGYKYEKVPA